MRPFQFYFVSTPIGNLEDISGRAVSMLGSVDFLLAEDTRKTRILLARHGIEVPLRPYHDFNKEKVIGSIVESLRGGKTGALVSDAGTPCVSDPGFYLARRLIEEGITFTSLPGASAVTTALVLSGLPPDRFAFFGYLPKKKGAIEKVLLEAGAFTGTSIFFESPHRIVKTLESDSRAPRREGGRGRARDDEASRGGPEGDGRRGGADPRGAGRREGRDNVIDKRSGEEGMSGGAAGPDPGARRKNSNIRKKGKTNCPENQISRTG